MIVPRPTEGHGRAREALLLDRLQAGGLRLREDNVEQQTERGLGEIDEHAPLQVAHGHDDDERVVVQMHHVVLAQPRETCVDQSGLNLAGDLAEQRGRVGLVVVAGDGLAIGGREDIGREKPRAKIGLERVDGVVQRLNVHVRLLVL